MPGSQHAWHIYSDGGCAPSNPGPAGWGVVCEPPNGQDVIERCGFLGHGTNQVAELSGAIEGLKLTPEGALVVLVSDSQYVIKGLSEWRRGWERRGWRNAKGEQVANADLWRALFSLADARKVSPRWVRGHNGHAQNERADRLVAKALQEKTSP